MDFKTVRDKTAALLSNPRILTFTLIGTTTMLIGAFLFFGDDADTEKPIVDAEEIIPFSSNPVAAVANSGINNVTSGIREATSGIKEATEEATEAITSPLNMFANQDDEKPPQQTGGKRKKKTRRGKKQRKSRSTKRKF